MDHNGIDWNRIENFVGFGRPGAPVVFIGLEEGLLTGTDLLADLHARSTYDQYMDLYKAQRALKDCAKYFNPKAVTQRTWRPMCHLMLRRFGMRPTNSLRRQYQAVQLGRSDGDTLLTELLPYPSHDKGAWPYGTLGRFNTRESYEREMLPKRIRFLREVLKQYPDIVVCYGKAHWSDFEKLFEEANWRNVGVFRTAVLGTTNVVLAPHLSGRAFNTEEQLNEFADIALSQPPRIRRAPTEEELRMMAPALIADDFERGKSNIILQGRADEA